MNHKLSSHHSFAPPEPEQPQMYHKFMAHLEGSGIHVKPTGSKLKILALTNNDVRELAGNREVSNSETIKFAKPILNPVMEEPTRRTLGLTLRKNTYLSKALKSEMRNVFTKGLRVNNISHILHPALEYAEQNNLALDSLFPRKPNFRP